MNQRGIMGGLFRVCEWIMRLSVVNLLWLICSLPVVYFLFVMFYQIPVEGWLSGILMVGILAPFTFFPATAAMFSTARKWVMGDTDVPLLKTFFKGYKQNYFQSMIGGFIYFLLGIMLYINFWFYKTQTGALGYLVILLFVLTFFVIASLFHFFSVLVHFHMKLKQLLKNSLLLTVGNPIGSIVLVLLNFGIIYVSFMMMRFLIPVFFMGTVMAMCSFWFFYRTFLKMKSDRENTEQEEQEEQEERAELEEKTDADREQSSKDKS